MRKARLDDEVTAFEVADITHSLAENLHVHIRRRGRRQIANTHGLHGLLRARRERPCGCRAADERDELAALHSITSSASARSAGGIVNPSALAALRFTTSSKVTGCCIGRGPGFSPRRILSMLPGAPRCHLRGLAPLVQNPPISIHPPRLPNV